MTDRVGSVPLPLLDLLARAVGPRRRKIEISVERGRSRVTRVSRVIPLVVGGGSFRA